MPVLTFKKTSLTKGWFLIKALRIPEWRAYIGLSIYGVALSSGNLFSFISNVLRLLPLMFIYVSTAYLANNIYDAKGDYFNQRKRERNPISVGCLSPREATIVLVILIALGLTSIIFLNFLQFTVYIVGLFLALAYSVPPLRLKEKPPLDLISHAFFFGIIPFLTGFLMNFTVSHPDPMLLASIAIYSMFLELRNEVEDFHPDREAGYNTTATCIGYQNSIRSLSFLSMIFIVASYVTAWSRETYVFSAITAFTLASNLIPLRHETKMRIMDAYAVTFYLLILLADILR